jgi:two-component system chemotaxis response regulator CheB
METPRNSVLVVDDDSTIRLGFRSLLEEYGFEVETARDGREGLNMPPGFTGPMAEFLDDQSAVRVLEARQFDLLEPGKALVAPAPFHMYVEKGDGAHIALSPEPVDSICSPRIDCTMSSAANVFGAGVTGVVLSGMAAGSDCIKGAEAIRESGGRVLTQAREGCTCYFMPKAVVDAGYSDAEVSLEQMHERILAVMGVT